MRRIFVIRRWYKWVGLFLSLLILMAWTISMVWRGEYWRRTDNTRGLLFLLDVGTFGIYRVINITCNALLNITRQRQVFPRPVWWIKPLQVDGRIGFIYLVVPLWIPFLLVAIPTAYLFRRDHRIPQGHCQKCGYDLTGNISGVCPECGEKI